MACRFAWKRRRKFPAGLAGAVEEVAGKVCVPPTDIPNVGRFSVIADPQGAAFSLIQMTAMHHPATA